MVIVLELHKEQWKAAVPLTAAYQPVPQVT